MKSYTMIDNRFLDFAMKNLTGASVNVYLAISRKTVGYQKLTDKIAYSQLCKLTGLSLNSVKNGIKELKNYGLISQKKVDNGYIYSLKDLEYLDVIEEVVEETNERLSKIDMSKTDNKDNKVSKIDISKTDKTISKNDMSKSDISKIDGNLSKIDIDLSKIDTKEYQKLTPQKKKETLKENSKDNVQTTTKNTKSKRFKKPSVQDIRAYCLERKNEIDAQHFFDYYESKGWVVGKSPMKDWRACVRTWERNKIKTNSSNSSFIEQGSNEYWESINQEELVYGL